MRRLALLPLLLLTSSCGDLLALHTLQLPSDRVTEPALEGRWENDNMAFTVQPSAGLYYVHLVGKRDPSEPRDYHVRLVELNGVRFADLLWTEALGHMVARLTVSGAELRVAFWDSKWLRDRVPHEEADVNNNAKQSVLTAPTARLRALVSQYAKDPRAYDPQELVFHRR